MNKQQDLTKIKGTLRRVSTNKTENELWSRFVFGLGKIKDIVYLRDKAKEYDDNFAPILQNLLEANFCKDKVINLINNHNKDISEEKDGKAHGFQLDINNPIDKELNIYFKDVFIRGAMAIDGLMKHTRYMGYPVEFIFSEEEEKFKKGLKKFPLSEEDKLFKTLKDVIHNHRDNWYSDFRKIRNKIEHKGYKLPDVQYIINKGKIVAIYPRFEEQSIEEYLEIASGNLTTLCEEVIAYILSLKLPEPWTIVEISKDKRDPSMPIRFDLQLKM